MSRIPTRFLLFPVIFGIGALGYGYEEWTLSQVALAEPQQLSVSELTTEGWGDNAHIVLQEFLCPDYFVYSDKGLGDGYKQIWIPAVPLDGPYQERLMAAFEAEEAGAEAQDVPPPDNILLIITSKDCRDDDALATLMDADTLQGMIVNEIDSIDRDTADLLTAEFPELDTEGVVIFESGRSPTSKDVILGSAAGGLVLLIGSLVLFLGRRRRTPEEVESA